MADASGNIDPADGAAFDNWDVAPAPGTPPGQ
jgi:hypothetical protein